MTPSNLWIILGIVIFLAVPCASTAEEETATAADLAQLASRQQQLQAEFDDRLRAWVDAAIEKQGEALAIRTTALLRQQIARGTYRRNRQDRPDDAQSQAMPAPLGDQATTQVTLAGNTACSMVGHTLECVLRELASP